MEQLSREQMHDILYKMCVARAFEERVLDMFSQGKIHGTTHLSIGEEASAVGAISVLRPDDIIMSGHRGHSHLVAKGADVNLMMAELLGKKAGYCKGLGGSMHIVDLSKNNYGANGVIGPAIPIATGVALGLAKENKGKVILNFFGDGTSNTGNFYEAVNMAALWKLPIVYICENNLYGMSTPIEKTCSVPNIADRAAAFGIPGEIVDGNDILAVREACAKAIERARSGNGPTLIEHKTYRWLGHSKSDKRVYRTKEEEAAWKAKCPIKRFKAYMLKNGFTQAELDDISAKAEQVNDDAVAFAESCEEIMTPEEAKELVFVKEEYLK